MLEHEILKSFVVYPQDIDNFLKNVEFEAFSKQGREVLKVIQKLRDDENLNLNTLESEIGALKNSEWFIDFLNAEENINYLNLKGIFIKNYILDKQVKIAQKLVDASNANQVLDLDTFKASHIFLQDFKNLNDWLNFYAQKPAIQKYFLNIPFLDMCFDNGIEGGQLVLISGDPEAGKTMLGLQMLENIASNFAVGFFCFEFTIDGYLKLKQKNPLSKTQAQNMIIINEGYDINEIALNIKALYKKNVRCFLIDSQMRITSPQGRNMEEEESLKFSTLARLCHSLGIVVFLIVQTAKGDRDNPMGSKKGGHEASIIIRVERCAPQREDVLQKGEEFDANARIVLVKKNKQTGRHFKERVFFDVNALRFSNFAREELKHIDLKEIEKELNIDGIFL